MENRELKERFIDEKIGIEYMRKGDVFGLCGQQYLLFVTLKQKISSNTKQLKQWGETEIFVSPYCLSNNYYSKST